MLNSVVLIGRIIEIGDFIEDKVKVKISVPRSVKNEEGEYVNDIIEVILQGNIAANTTEYVKNGDLVGIKGRIQVELSTMEIIADKVTFLSTENSKQ